ncbi:MAG: Rieske 2Fe-2S domain-containing protein [Methylocystis sp.]
MSKTPNWVRICTLDEAIAKKVHVRMVSGHAIAVSCRDGVVGVVSNKCNHVGGPLGEGDLDGDYLVCPWHNWKFHRCNGAGEPGFEGDVVPAYSVKIENRDVFADLNNPTPRRRLPHAPHPLARQIKRDPGGLRVAGISTTGMDTNHPRFSGSEFILEHSLVTAREHGAETKLIKLRELNFRACEGYYSKSARACTWPCSITQMDENDGMTPVYEALVHWADVVLIATPIRWGAASSLHFKMAERLNCVQNQLTIANRVLIRNKIAAFIIIGGQDNVQAVAGQMMGFFAELGFLFPQFPYIAHTRGWSKEDMERNVQIIRESHELKSGAEELMIRCMEMARRLIDLDEPFDHFVRGGRKAQSV